MPPVDVTIDSGPLLIKTNRKANARSIIEQFISERVKPASGRSPMKRNRASAGIDRRMLLKSSAATGAVLATGAIALPAIALAKPIKLGYVSPQTGPLAAFAEADNFIIANFKDATKAGIKVGSATAPVEVIVKDSQSNPNRAAQVAKDLIVQD